MGDKLASRHGQKGIIGSIMPSSMMPFTKDGLVPDIIMNPHAFPSRMTIGHLIECVMDKAGALGGFYVDGTTFEDQDVDSFSSVLNKHGFNGRGDEIMYNGMTGTQINCEIFIGPTYYFRLKHMVSDKVNSRDTGQTVGLTHQPTKGRGNGGGLRIGEMENNVLLAHGISAFTKETMMEKSDKCVVDVSAKGELGVISNHARKIGEFGDKKVEVPFAFNLMSNELIGLGVQTLVKFEKDDDFEYDDDVYQDAPDAPDDEDENKNVDEDFVKIKKFYIDQKLGKYNI
jgi:DNA-directed RNA polymerase II subunit RPB2